MATICPNCKRHTLSPWERISLDYWVPKACPRCRGLIVNWVGAELLWAMSLLTAVVLAAAAGIPFFGMVLLSPLLVAARALFVRPLRYQDFKPYGKRPWWQNMLIFVLFPLVLVGGVLCIALVSGWGK